MLRFTNRIEALLLLASALTTLPMTADAQNWHPQGRAAPAVRTMGPVRFGASFVRPVAPFVRPAVPAPAPRLMPQIAVPRAPAQRGPRPPIGTPYIAAPTGISPHVVPPQLGPSVSLPSSIRREVTGGGAADPAGRPGLTSRIIVRRVPDGAEIAGRTQIDNHAAIIRGPFLRNPAFAQPSGGNIAALRLGRTTFRGRFADQPRRLQHRTAVIGWIGPLFWPFAFSDFIDYTFWPYAYDSFWPRAYDDVYEGIVGPYVVEASDVPDVNVPLSSPGSASPSAPQAETDLAQICAERRSGLTEWPIERIAQVVEPDDAQRSALNEFKDATAQAVTRLLSACPTQLPSTPTGRLAAMRMRLEIMLQAVEIVQPALDKFYQSLNDEQKARFNTVGPEVPQTAGEVRSANEQGPDVTQVCSGQVAVLAELPIARIAEAVRPTPQQRTALEILDAASTAAAEFLNGSCDEGQPLTPPGRLKAMEQRLGAVLQAVTTMQPALERFYNSLNDEQKAHFNLLGTQER